MEEQTKDLEGKQKERVKELCLGLEKEQQKERDWREMTLNKFTGQVKEVRRLLLSIKENMTHTETRVAC